MMRALYSSVAGLKTHQTKMDVIGNNIANVNTVGFKSSRTTFATMMYQTTSFASGANAQTGKGGVNAKQIGLGTTFASTAIDIDTGGSSESTGKAFDLKLSDKNSTSFYIVNTGTENVFTRAGAFYVDGAGNLCMESTGYMVMGWQVDANGNIRKDTVSPLKIMSTDNQTSQPEYTTKGVCTGILDDNTSNVNSDTGYRMNLNFFDNLGYSYTAQFAAQKMTADGEYAINLIDIKDSNGKSIISGSGTRLSDLFGTDNAQGSKVNITDNYILASGMAGALRRIATTPKPAVDANGNAIANSDTKEYNFPASVINQYMSYTNIAGDKFTMPDGYTIRYTLTRTGTDTATPASSYSMALYDAAGNRVARPETVLPAGWLNTVTVDATTGAMTATPLPENADTSTMTGVELVKRDTVYQKLQEWLDAGDFQNKLEGSTDSQEIYKLNSSQLKELASKFSQVMGITAGNTPTTDGVNLEVVITNPNSSAPEFEIREATGYTATAPWDKLIGKNDALQNATQLTTLRDYLGFGYLIADVDTINNRDVFTTKLPPDVEFRYYEGDGHYEILTPATDGFLAKFSTSDGSLTYIGQQGSTTQTLRLSNYKMEGDTPNPFSDIQIDFSTLQNLANGGSSTAAMSNGNRGEGDGKMVGTLIGLSVDQGGRVFGSYSNGNTTCLGQIAVARFGNASGLESIGDNCYRTTMNSGQFDGIGVEMDSDGSTMDSGTLEMSNVDLATEFTQMITTQRGYQANSRVISTSDSILEELVNLKR